MARANPPASPAGAQLAGAGPGCHDYSSAGRNGVRRSDSRGVAALGNAERGAAGGDGADVCRPGSVNSGDYSACTGPRKDCPVRSIYRLHRGVSGRWTRPGKCAGSGPASHGLRRPVAHLTILLLPSLEASLARARRRNGRQIAQGTDENRFETEGRAFYERVFLKYQEIAARETLRVVTIAEDASVDAIEKRIVEVVEERLARVAATA